MKKPKIIGQCHFHVKKLQQSCKFMCMRDAVHGIASASSDSTWVGYWIISWVLTLSDKFALKMLQECLNTYRKMRVELINKSLEEDDAKYRKPNSYMLQNSAYFMGVLSTLDKWAVVSSKFRKNLSTPKWLQYGDALWIWVFGKIEMFIAKVNSNMNISFETFLLSKF